MTFQLAQPTFLSGPRDALATADIYTRRSGAVINAIQDITKMRDPDLQSMLRGGAFLSAQLPILQGLNLNGTLNISKDNLIARLTISSGSLVSGIRNMTSGLAASISANIPSVGQVMATVNGVTRSVSDAVLTDLNSIGRTIGDITKNAGIFSVSDMSAQIGLYTGIVMEGSRLGLPNTLGGLMASVNDPYLLRRVVSNVLPTLTVRGDIGSISFAASVMPAGAMRMAYPNAIRDYGRNYVAPRATNTAQYQSNYRGTMDTFQAMDPQWNQARRQPAGGSSVALNLTKLLGGSKGMQKMLSIGVQLTSTPEEKYYALAGQYEPTSVDRQLQRQFPRTVVGNGQRTSRQVVDPRTLTYPQVEKAVVVNRPSGPIDSDW